MKERKSIMSREKVVNKPCGTNFKVPATTEDKVITRRFTSRGPA